MPVPCGSDTPSHNWVWFCNSTLLSCKVVCIEPWKRLLEHQASENDTSDGGALASWVSSASPGYTPQSICVCEEGPDWSRSDANCEWLEMGWSLSEGLSRAWVHALPTWSTTGRGWPSFGNCFSEWRAGLARDTAQKLPKVPLGRAKKGEVSRGSTPHRGPSSLGPPTWWGLVHFTALQTPESFLAACVGAWGYLHTPAPSEALKNYAEDHILWTH